MSSITHTAGAYFALVLDLTEYAIIAEGARLKMVIRRAPGYTPIATIHGGIGGDGVNWTGVIISESHHNADWPALPEAQYQVTLIPKTAGLEHVVQEGRITIHAKL